MAFLLRFDGSNDYVTLDVLVGGAFADRLDTNQEWVLEWKFKRSGSDGYVHRFFDNSSGTEEILYRASDGLFRVSLLSGQLADWTGVSTNLTDPATFRIVKVGGLNQYELLVDDGTGGGFISYGTRSAGSGVQIFRLDIIGRSGTTGYINGDLYYVSYTTTNSGVNFNADPSASNGTGQVLPDTVGGNDGTLVNFPNDDSQWVFYDDGQGGGDTLIPTLIPSGEVVGTPSVTNLLQLVEANAIPTQEVVQTPVIETGAILISPATIPTGEVVYNVSVVDLTQFIEAEAIPTQEVVGSPSLELLLSRIFPTAIATQENFETPLIIGGDRIAIPINDRATWNRVAAYLRTRKFSGNDNDVILAWLRSEGYIDTFNDAFNTYLEDVEALDGSLTDKYSNWRRQ